MNTFRNHRIKLDIIWTDLDAAMFPAPTWLHLREDMHKLKWSPTHPMLFTANCFRLDGDCVNKTCHFNNLDFLNVSVDVGNLTTGLCFSPCCQLGVY